MYTVEFYEKADGNSELWDFLEDLRKKAANNKDARIQYKKTPAYNISKSACTLNCCKAKVLGCRIILPNILKKIFGSFVRATIEYSTFTFKKTLSYCCINFAKSPKRHQNVKLRKQKPNVMITCAERRRLTYENME